MTSFFAAVTAIATFITAVVTIATFLQQRKRNRANVVFLFHRTGNRLIPYLQNTGESTAREIKLETKPPLAVVCDIDKEYKGYQRTQELQVLGTTIHTLEVGQIIEDLPGFEVADFKRQFISYSTLYACVSFVSANDGHTYKNQWQIDLAPLTRPITLADMI